MESNLQESLKKLEANYKIHILLFSLMIIFEITNYFKTFWLSKSSRLIFLSCLLFSMIFLSIGIIPLYLINKRLFKENSIKKFKIVTFICIFISFIRGIISNFALWKNVSNSQTFVRECPYNFNSYDLNQIFNNYQQKEDTQINEEESIFNIEDKCLEKRCILLENANMEKIFPYEYICNYNSEKDFGKINGKQIYSRTNPNGEEFSSRDVIKCENYENNKDNLIKQEDINNYYSFCLSKTEFFKCERFYGPIEYDHIKKDYTCPDNQYIKILYILGVIIAVFEIPASIIKFIKEYIVYRNIVNIINITRERGINLSINSTRQKSEMKEENEENYKKETTEIIMVVNGNLQNYENIDSKSNLNNEPIIEMTYQRRNSNNNNAFNNNDKSSDISSQEEDARKDEKLELKINKLKSKDEVTFDNQKISTKKTEQEHNNFETTIYKRERKAVRKIKHGKQSSNNVNIKTLNIKEEEPENKIKTSLKFSRSSEKIRRTNFFEILDEPIRIDCFC